MQRYGRGIGIAERSHMYENDEPTLHDLLGRNSLAERIGREISTCFAPQVYGIHGDWGLGKTSFMHTLHLYLTGECPESHEWSKKTKIPAGWGSEKHTRVVWFEAWRYQHEPNPIVALLQEIRTQLQWSAKIRNVSKKLMEVSIYSALFEIESVSKYLGFKPSGIQRIGEDWESAHYATQLPTHVIRGLLEKAIGDLLPKQANDKAPLPKLVVLIDDLDRCESGMAYRLLEGIKIYLNLKNCVFVLGMDQHLIELAVQSQQCKEMDSGFKSVLASEYVEKICRCIWHLPLVEEPADILYKILARTSEPLKNVDLGGLESAEALDFDNPNLAVAKVVRAYRCLPGNPRKVKAYAEVLRRFIEQVPRPKGTFDVDFEEYVEVASASDMSDRSIGKRKKRTTYRLSKWAALSVAFSIIYHFHRNLYRILEAEPKFFHEIVRWAGTDEIESEGHFRSMRRSRLRREDAGGLELWNSTFSDPMRGDIMRIGELLSALRDTSEEDLLSFILQYPESQG